MPTVRRIGPYRFFFYSNDAAEPAHIHVQRDRCLAKWWLDPPVLSRMSGFAPYELRRIERIVTRHRIVFLEAWREFFGR